jgi:hypothetical protein
MTVAEFIAKYNLKVSVIQDNKVPYEKLDDWQKKACPWTIIIYNGRKRMTINFWTGIAITEEPTLETVLECLVGDAAGVNDSTTFEEWANEYGYDTDSRKAESTYKAVMQEATKLKKLLGPEAYKEMFEIEF